MTPHYTRFERSHMETLTLLASDPRYWRTYSNVVEGDE